LSAADDAGNDAHDLVVAAAAAGGTGGQLLHGLELLLHIGKPGVAVQSVVNVSHGHLFAVADDVVGKIMGRFHDSGLLSLSSWEGINRSISSAGLPEPCRVGPRHDTIL